MQLILVAESEVDSRRQAQKCLEEAGYAVRACPAASLVAEAVERQPSLILIGTASPGSSNLELCRRVRPLLSGKTPVILLLAGATEADRIQALESGADDCVSKPFSPRELVARMQAVLRCPPRPLPAPATETETPDLVIDRSAMILSVRGGEVATTALEFRLVDYLARHRGRVFTRDNLLDEVWGDMQFVTPRSVDACIRRIRDKIEPNRATPTYLKTVRGVGYRLDAIAAWHSSSTEGCTCAACVAARSPSAAIPNGHHRRRRVPPAE